MNMHLQREENVADPQEEAGRRPSGPGDRR